MEFLKRVFRKKEAEFEPTIIGGQESGAIGTEMIKENKQFEQLILGTTSSGKAHKPWDNLKPCSCGEKPLLMYEKEAPMKKFVMCPNCGNHTINGNLKEVIELWNLEKHDDGVYYGINDITGASIYYDKNRLNTGHELILGIPGSGKSYLCKKELKSIYKYTNDAIIVIQDTSENVRKEIPKVEDEYMSYSSLAELYNEKHIRVPEYCINPFNLYKSEVEIMDADLIIKKSEFIMNFISVVNGSELTAKQKYMIDKSIQKIYATYNDEAAPSLLTLIKELKNQKSNELEFIIKKLEGKLTEGLNNFNCSNKIDFDSRFTVYSMYGVKKEVYYETILVLLESIWNIVVSNGGKGIRTHIVIDSIEYLLENKSINIYISEIIKRLRVNRGMITLIGTNTENILNDKYLKSIINNIETIRILSQLKKDLKIIDEFFKIPEKLNSYFYNVEYGTGLLLNYAIKIPFHYVED